MNFASQNTVSKGSDLVSQWRNDAGQGNPAGPLFGGSKFAEADIASESVNITVACGTGCSGSRTRQCC